MATSSFQAVAVQKTFFALTNSLPPRKPELRSAWRMDLNVRQKNCARKIKDRTRKRVTEINGILSGPHCACVYWRFSFKEFSYRSIIDLDDRPRGDHVSI